MRDPYLTNRERGVLMLLVHGYSDQDIADILKVKPRVVRDHILDVRDRVGATNRPHMVWLCVQHQLLNPWTGVVA